MLLYRIDRREVKKVDGLENHGAKCLYAGHRWAARKVREELAEKGTRCGGTDPAQAATQGNI